ncbi:SDR family NAD(P)-dependent oxidoreductase [Xanthobacter autotrophicus]|uniref:SDR family NAD(P)-dependent oxidoreductase n=1 Tax=Xanthobacter autotrophicus TaxID=280 RepID=UPI00372B6DA6
MLEGKVALVTGAGRGLGREHALALAAAGARVVVNDFGGSNTGEGSDAGPAAKVAAEIAAAGGEAVPNTGSVGDWDEAAAMVAQAIDTFGGIDIIVNNAGINRVAALGQVAEQDWDLSNNVIAKGTFATINAAAAHWVAIGPRAGRAVINTASPAALHPAPAISVYSAAKAAVVSLSQAAALELAPLGVRVNVIAPMARTRMLEGAPPEIMDLMAPRAGFDPNLPEHVAQLVVYLAGPLCRFTGRVFGGWGDQVFLFKEWDAAFQAGNNGVKWTSETLAAALAGFPARDSRQTLFPGGKMLADMPPAELLDALDKMALSEPVS